MANQNALTAAHIRYLLVLLRLCLPFGVTLRVPTAEEFPTPAAQTGGAPVQTAPLPGGAELVPAASFDGIARTFVAVDVPTRERIGEAAAALLEGCDLTVTVDHHAVDSTMTDLVYVDPDAASTTMLRGFRRFLQSVPSAPVCPRR